MSKNKTLKSSRRSPEKSEDPKGAKIMLKKLTKKLAKLEKKYETAKPVERKRIMKAAEATQKRIDFLISP